MSPEVQRHYIRKRITYFVTRSQWRSHPFQRGVGAVSSGCNTPQCKSFPSLPRDDGDTVVSPQLGMCSAVSSIFIQCFRGRALRNFEINNFLLQNCEKYQFKKATCKLKTKQLYLVQYYTRKKIKKNISLKEDFIQAIVVVKFNDRLSCKLARSSAIEIMSYLRKVNQFRL